MSSTPGLRSSLEAIQSRLDSARDLETLSQSEAELAVLADVVIEAVCTEFATLVEPSEPSAA